MSLRIIPFLITFLILCGAFVFGCGDDDNPANPNNGIDSTAVITGLVTDSDTDDPVGGAGVSSDDGGQTTSDDEGVYHLEVKLGERTITVEAEGYFVLTETVAVVNNDTLTANYEIERNRENDPATLTGNVWDAETNLGIPSATVRSGNVNTTTDNEGAYRLELLQGTHTISVSADGYEPAELEIEILGGQSYSQDFTLVLSAESYGTVTGVVRDSNSGDVIEGASLATGDIEVTTNADGEYEMQLLPGDHVIIASARNHQSIAEEVEVEAQQAYTVNFTLAPSGGGGEQEGIVEGTVVDASNQDPISGATVIAAGIGTQTDNAGRYSFEIPVGFQNVTASANGFDPVTQSLMVANGGNHTLNFALNPTGGGGETGNVSGTVINSQTSRPISGANITAGGRSTITNPNGQYSFAVPAGVQIVRAVAAGYQSATQNLVVEVDGNHTVDFSLNPGGGGGDPGTITGAITNALSGRVITFVRVECAGVIVYTDLSGNYTMQVPSGPQTMNVETLDYEPQSRNVNVVAGQTQTQNFALQPTGGGGSGEIRGYVRNTGGNVIVGARVSSDDGYSTTTNGSGYYSFDVGAGNRTITASAAGYRSATRQVFVETNTWQQLDFVLSQ